MTSLQQQASEEELAHAERVSRRREDPSWNSVHGKGDRLIFHVGRQDHMEFQPVPFSMRNCQSESCIYCNYLVYI